MSKVTSQDADVLGSAPALLRRGYVPYWEGSTP